MIDNDRAEAAAAAGLPSGVGPWLRGDTRQALAADAKALHLLLNKPDPKRLADDVPRGI